MYLDSSLVNKQYPTLTELQKAFKLSDYIDYKARDSRPLTSIIKRITNVSPRLKGLIETRNTGVIAYDFTIRAVDKSDVEPIKQRNLKNFQKILKAPVHNSLYGDYLAKVVYDAVKGIEIKQYDQTDYEPINENEFYLYDSSGKKELINVLESPRQYIYLWDGSINRGGVLRTVLDSEIRRFETNKEWSIYNKRAKGQILGIMDALRLSEMQRVTGANIDISKMQDDFNGVLAKVGEDNYASTSDAFKVQFANLVDASANTSYMNQIKMLDDSISIAIVGQANTTQLPSSGGSRAALQVLNLIKNDILYRDMQAVKELMNEFLLLDYQFTKNISAISCPFFFEWKYDENVDIESNARVFANIATFRPDTEVYTQEFYDKIGMKKPDTLIDEIMQIGAIQNINVPNF